jgi:inorganic pyrophosphatase
MMDTLYYCYTFVSTVGVTGMAAGRLATLACGLTIDGFGPISDNAGGIAEMALFNPEAWNIMEWHGMAGKTEGHRAKICEDMRRWGLLD